MGTHHPIRKTVTPEAPVIPDKLYFRIGDVASICEVPAYVLRFWETEFPQLKPNKGGTGQRLYRRKDVEMALRIKSLLYDQGYTIPGARQVFKTEVKAKETTPFPEPASAPPQITEVTGTSQRVAPQHLAQLHALRDDLRHLLGELSKSSTASTPAANDKVKSMRPRLAVVESKAEPKPVATKPVKVLKPMLKLEQRDLFAFDPPDGDIPA